MIISIIVMIFCFIMTLLMSVCVIKLDEIEKHDFAVRMRWEKERESEPPEWADPEKWYESENAPIFHVGYDNDQMGREK